jgi:hypothetical protein
MISLRGGKDDQKKEEEDISRRRDKTKRNKPATKKSHFLFSVKVTIG